MVVLTAITIPSTIGGKKKNMTRPPTKKKTHGVPTLD